MCLLSYPAHGWETDQLTARADPLPEVTEAANAWIDAAIDEAIDRAARRLRPGASDLRARRVLARHIRRQTSRDQRVPGRGPFRALGYGAFSAWLETADLPRVTFLDGRTRTDVFAGLPALRAPILGSLGVCSTVTLGGVRMGTDKPDHFLETGWRMGKRLDRRGLDAAVRYSTRTENTFFGWYTSSAFSWGDLAANWAGAQFYRDLLDADRGIATWDGRALRRTRAFDWRDHVDDRWDELRNPPTYRPAVVRWLDARPDADWDALCEGWEAWGPAVDAPLPPQAGASDGIGPRARPRVDPFRLGQRCEEVP